MYDTMLFRRRFCKRIFLTIFFIVCFCLSFYVSVLLFGDFKMPRVMHLTELDKCPACYGVSICPELYSDMILLKPTNHWGMFNAKNIYYGYTKSQNRKVVLKKLSHKWELMEFDQKLCESWGLKHCKPIDLLNISNIDEKIINLVQYNLSFPETEPRKGLVMCPYAYSIYDLLHPMLTGKPTHKSDIINVWTMLSTNPEPIILQAIPKQQGWPVPAYAGVCGRIEVVAYEGEPLTSLLHLPWHRKLKFAKKILDAAMDFTFKHDRFRFYLMDWSLDNIVANNLDEISFVDLEDIVVLDKHISPREDLKDWYQRYTRESTPGFSFSIENMCKHHLSDHNFWAACYILAGEEDKFLYPIPDEILRSKPHFDRLLNDCLNGEDRFQTIIQLHHVMTDMLMDTMDSKIVSSNDVR